MQLQTLRLEETAPTRGLKLQSFSCQTALTQAKSSLQLEFLVDETLCGDGLQIHKIRMGSLQRGSGDPSLESPLKCGWGKGGQWQHCLQQSLVEPSLHWNKWEPSRSDLRCSTWATHLRGFLSLADGPGHRLQKKTKVKQDDLIVH